MLACFCLLLQARCASSLSSDASDAIYPKYSMSRPVTSNDQDADSEEITLGNDGCPVVTDRLSNSPSSVMDSPRTAPTHKRVNSLVATLKGAFFDDFCFEDSPDYVASFKKVIVDGKDILALRTEDIERMSKEEVKELLVQLHFEGNLRKKGFRGLQMWKRRFFSISGPSFMYYDVCDCPSADT